MIRLRCSKKKRRIKMYFHTGAKSKGVGRKSPSQQEFKVWAPVSSGKVLATNPLSLKSINIEFELLTSDRLICHLIDFKFLTQDPSKVEGGGCFPLPEKIGQGGWLGEENILGSVLTNASHSRCIFLNCKCECLR